ncbi:hypothetical protein ACFL67_02750 [candidate division KSB1 bacterium]
MMFLKSRGIVLSDDAVQEFKKRLDEEPVSKPTLEQSKSLTRNKFFADILDRTFVSRSNKVQNIVESNPILQLIDLKKKELTGTENDEPPPMPDNLRKVFYQEEKWQPFKPFLGVPPEGRIVKIIEMARPDMPYIGFLKQEAPKTFIYTTRRKLNLDELHEAKYYRLKEGLFQYEIDEIKDIEKGYIKYIMAIH